MKTYEDLLSDYFDKFGDVPPTQIGDDPEVLIPLLEMALIEGNPLAENPTTRDPVEGELF